MSQSLQKEDFGGRRAAMLAGIRRAAGTPAIVLGASFTGFGALVHQTGLSVWHALFSTATGWAQPGQVALFELYVLGASILVIGAGPMLDMVRGAVGPLVVSRGRQPRLAVSQAMARAAYLIVPSIAPESFGRAVVEAFSHGLPVIASRRGALAEIVDNRVTGLLVEPDSPAALAEAVRWAEANPGDMSRMGVNARAVYEREYTPERNYRLLSAIYAAVSDSRVLEDLA